jgi:hypothetical protein
LHNVCAKIECDLIKQQQCLLRTEQQDQIF